MILDGIVRNGDRPGGRVLAQQEPRPMGAADRQARCLNQRFTRWTPFPKYPGAQ
ncbi:predicted protein [Streptomyces sp. C]|nr:predicted protein [Streptomyces sp. C]